MKTTLGNSFKESILTSALLVLFAMNLNATDYYVNDVLTAADSYCTEEGLNTNDGLSPSTPKATLTNLLGTYGPSGTNVLTSGDKIYIDAGIFLETDKNLVISVAGLEIIGRGANLTVFDNNDASADANLLFTITGNNVHICCIMIKGYNKGTGGASAVHINGATGVLFTNVLTDENTPGGGSSAILINNSSSVTFNGGGSNCNSANSVAGGGVNVEGINNTVTFNDYSFARNSKDFQGGSGLYVLCTNGSTVVNVNRCIIADNLNQTSVGGAVFVTGATVNFANCCFSNNQSGQVSSTNYGGAISVGRGATVNVSNCTFTGNSVTSSSRGGAIAINPLSITNGGVGSSTVNLTTCTFSGNTAAQGNHLYCRTDNTTRHGIFNVSNCTFVAPGSGVSVQSVSANSTITLANSGNPSSSGTSGSVIFTNTTAPSGVASTSCPTLQGSCYSVILPVELLDFTGYCKENLVTLSWSTASERNNDQFFVHKLNTLNEFELVGFVDGSGSTSSTSHYTFEDRTASYGSAVYKLSQRDYDGNEEELKTIVVYNNCLSNENHFNIFQHNESALTISANISAMDDVSIEIIDMTGKIIQQENARLIKGNAKLEIDLHESISTGIYTVRIYGVNTIFNQRVSIK
jgi:hypothetical protein